MTNRMFRSAEKNEAEMKLQKRKAMMKEEKLRCGESQHRVSRSAYFSCAEQSNERNARKGPAMARQQECYERHDEQRPTNKRRAYR